MALVGYTNAGKTTLFNRLTQFGCRWRRTRCSSRSIRWCAACGCPIGRELLLSDTVGFIDRLPHALVAAFRATLEETAEADLVLHVIDASSPERERHMAAVDARARRGGRDRSAAHRRLQQGRSAVRRRTAPAERRRSVGGARSRRRPARACDELLETIAARLALDQQRVSLQFDLGSEDDRERLAWLYRHARVHSQVTQGDRAMIEADVPRRLLDRVCGRGAAVRRISAMRGRACDA